MIKFIEIAIYCSLLNDFTMSHILYAILKEEQTNEITTENNEINNQSIPDENNETNDIIQSIPVETTKTPQYLDFDDISSESPRFDASETQTNQQNNQISINSHESQHNENTPEEKHNQFVKMSAAQRGLSPPAKPFLAQHNHCLFRHLELSKFSNLHPNNKFYLEIQS